LWIILDFICQYVLGKRSMIFQKSLTKSLIHKIKEYKNFQNFLTSTYRGNWKENVKNNKKKKKKKKKKNKKKKKKKKKQVVNRTI